MSGNKAWGHPLPPHTPPSRKKANRTAGHNHSRWRPCPPMIVDGVVKQCVRWNTRHSEHAYESTATTGTKP